MSLTLTENASSVVKAIVAQSDSESGGLRIAVEGDAAEFSISIVPEAQSDDTLIENDGAQVFLDANATTALADAVLDASVEDDGSVNFSVGPAA